MWCSVKVQLGTSLLSLRHCPDGPGRPGCPGLLWPPQRGEIAAWPRETRRLPRPATPLPRPASFFPPSRAPANLDSSSAFYTTYCLYLCRYMHVLHSMYVHTNATILPEKDHQPRCDLATWHVCSNLHGKKLDGDGHVISCADLQQTKMLGRPPDLVSANLPVLVGHAVKQPG